MNEDLETMIRRKQDELRTEPRRVSFNEWFADHGLRIAAVMMVLAIVSWFLGRL